MNRIKQKSTVLLLFLLYSPLLQARATSFDTLSLRPAADHGLYLSLYGSETLPPYDWTAGFMLDYARTPLSQIRSGVKSPIVRDLVGGHLAGAFGILNWFQMGIHANFALVEKFFHPTTGIGSTRARMGDTRLSAKFRLLEKKEDYLVGVAFIPYLDFPTGSGASFVGNNSFAGGGTFVVETRQIEDRLTFVLNLGYYARDKVLVGGATPFDDLLTFGLGANFVVVRWLELVAEFRGGTMISNFSTSGTPFEGGGGAHIYLGKDRRWQITPAISAGVGAGLGNPSVRGMVGVAYTPPRPVRGVELQESATKAFEVYELEEVDEMKELKEKCPPRGQFNPKRHDPRCIKVYLSQ